LAGGRAAEPSQHHEEHSLGGGGHSGHLIPQVGSADGRDAIDGHAEADWEGFVPVSRRSGRRRRSDLGSIHARDDLQSPSFRQTELAQRPGNDKGVGDDSSNPLGGRSNFLPRPPGHIEKEPSGMDVANDERGGGFIGDHRSARHRALIIGMLQHYYHA
jgi:hypothetical protein